MVVLGDISVWRETWNRGRIRTGESRRYDQAMKMPSSVTKEYSCEEDGDKYEQQRKSVSPSILALAATTMDLAARPVAVAKLIIVAID